ncbi:inactive phospholipase D5-like [Alligator mississippiensis]|uniref:Inactive phospholipase D5-like n=1 Tax=Alligator mississippiensis TaxID=8496 RepID=A0A151MHG5_ALLMI|nr:inactive phospholipase D5-like [Alligator mississippiensis]
MRLKSRPKEPSPSLARAGPNFYSTVKQQDYSASVWLRRKDKLEHVSNCPLQLRNKSNFQASGLRRAALKCASSVSVDVKQLLSF